MFGCKNGFTFLKQRVGRVGKHQRDHGNQRVNQEIIVEVFCKNNLGNALQCEIKEDSLSQPDQRLVLNPNLHGEAKDHQHAKAAPDGVKHNILINKSF